MIPYGRQSIDEDDIHAVVEVLRSDFLTQGPVVPKFEGAISSFCGARHAVAVNSATSALHIACLALGVGPGDWVWTSPITFVASANCALYCGAKVDFVDIEPDTGNMCVLALQEKLEQAAQEGKLPKVVIPVHFAGEPCDMEEIAALAEHYGFKIIEDAAHAVGAQYKGRNVGACVHSDITVFSFHPVKIITTAEGGAALTNDPILAKRMALLRQHGVTKDGEDLRDNHQGGWYYEQVDLGFNYRMTDIQAALGCSQLTKLPKFIEARHDRAQRYDRQLKELPFTPLTRKSNRLSALHLYVVLLREGASKGRMRVYEELRSRGIGVQVHYIPVHLQQFYEKVGFKKGDYPNAEKFYNACLSLPLFPSLSEAEQQTVISVIEQTL